MSLTKLTRKLLAFATAIHLDSLRASLKAYAAALQASLVAFAAAEQLALRAQEEYDQARHNELEALTRYTMEADTLGAKL